MSEYMHRPIMRGLDSLRPEDFAGVEVPFMPTRLDIYRTGAELQRRTRDVQQALSALALLVPEKRLNKSIFQEIDAIAAQTHIEKDDYETTGLKQGEAVVDWFDSIDNGTSLHAIAGDYHATPTGQVGYNTEHRTVQHTILRKADGVYGLSKYTWMTDDWRAIPKASSSSEHFYFARNTDGSMSPVVSVRSEDVLDENSRDAHAITSLVLTNDTARLQPSSWGTLGRRLKTFQQDYEAQENR